MKERQMKEPITFRKFIMENYLSSIEPNAEDVKGHIALKAIYDKCWPSEPETLPVIFDYLKACDADEQTKAEVLVMWICFVSRHWKELNGDQIFTIKQCVNPSIMQMIFDPQDRQIVRETMDQIMRVERQHFQRGDFGNGVGWRLI